MTPDRQAITREVDNLAATRTARGKAFVLNAAKRLAMTACDFLTSNRLRDETVRVFDPALQNRPETNLQPGGRPWPARCSPMPGSDSTPFFRSSRLSGRCRAFHA